VEIEKIDKEKAWLAKKVIDDFVNKDILF